MDSYKNINELLAGKSFSLETGKLAKQADGSVLAQIGDTQVLATVVSSLDPVDDNFLPLTVNYQEKAFSAGKIPGGYFKREGRPTESETLISRLIDRPLRPMFPKNYNFPTQVICFNRPSIHKRCVRKKHTKQRLKSICYKCHFVCILLRCKIYINLYAGCISHHPRSHATRFLKDFIHRLIFF